MAQQLGLLSTDYENYASSQQLGIGWVTKSCLEICTDVLKVRGSTTK
jgi:hypothetical protein